MTNLFFLFVSFRSSHVSGAKDASHHVVLFQLTRTAARTNTARVCQQFILPLCQCHTTPEPRPRTKHTAEQLWGKLGGAWQPQTNEKVTLQYSLLKKSVVVLIDVICHLANNSLFFKCWPTLWSNFIIPVGKSSCVLEHANWYKLVIYWLPSQHVLINQPELLELVWPNVVCLVAGLRWSTSS